MRHESTAEEILLHAIRKIAMIGAIGNSASAIALEALLAWHMRKDQTTIVNIRGNVEYDVYIGRPSKWGNPFRLADYGNDRQLVLKAYRYWLWRPAQKALRVAARKELKGKRLGCYCAPEACHGDVLREVIEQPEREAEDGRCT